ncbi:phosphoenolpyruvate carboxylase-related kinase 1 isoform X2 [Carex rostrata]
MAVASRSNGTANQPYHTSYKVPSLRNPILETPHISFLEDRYLLGPQLGWGQFGVIRTCTDLVTSETLACKSISKDRLISSDDLNSVKLEIEVMARLSGHPNVVDLKAVYEEEEYVHLVMELCAGGELFHRLEKHGRFSEHEAAVLFRNLIEVVMYCHEKGIIHRDLKPENILLASKSAYSQIKLADFGLATYITPGKSLHGMVGSPFYIAPEVLSGGYNEAADVWSAGVILYILLSGMPPFWGKTKSKIFESIKSNELQFPSDPWDQVSVPAKELISGMLKRNPRQRLHPKEVLDHPWITEHCNQPPAPCNQLYGTNLMQQEIGSFSFSSQQVTPCRDVSFSTPTPDPCQTRPDNCCSPTFTCRSSFSAFLAETTPTKNIGFSFSSDAEFSSPIPSMPSFSFSPLGRSEDQVDLRPEASNQIGTGMLLKCATSKETCASLNRLESADIGRVTKGNLSRTTGSSSDHSSRRKRNHTIGLGEMDQLDLTVSESIIRWASCTDLSMAPSLRSSLVC